MGRNRLSGVHRMTATARAAAPVLKIHNLAVGAIVALSGARSSYEGRVNTWALDVVNHYNEHFG